MRLDDKLKELLEARFLVFRRSSRVHWVESLSWDQYQYRDICDVIIVPEYNAGQLFVLLPEKEFQELLDSARDAVSCLKKLFYPEER